jgi:hypothetical protein
VVVERAQNQSEAGNEASRPLDFLKTLFVNLHWLHLSPSPGTFSVEAMFHTIPTRGLMLTTLFVGIILAWIYINTKGSIFAGMLGHAMFNWSSYVFPAFDVDASGPILFGLYFAVFVFILWRYDLKTFRPKG